MGYKKKKYFEKREVDSKKREEREKIRNSQLTRGYTGLKRTYKQVGDVTSGSAYNDDQPGQYESHLLERGKEKNKDFEGRRKRTVSTDFATVSKREQEIKETVRKNFPANRKVVGK